jgi:eukaryotic-like serine/threonine-protein kinase
MPRRIILKVFQGALSGQEFVLDGSSCCIIGRARDCSLRLPTDEAHRTVSRHHCLLNVNPPKIGLRDLGSLTGTYVNGEKIGQREKGTPPEEASKLCFPEHEVKPGDEIRVGNTVFRVEESVPEPCAERA